MYFLYKRGLPCVVFDSAKKLLEESLFLNTEASSKKYFLYQQEEIINTIIKEGKAFC